MNRIISTVACVAATALALSTPMAAPMAAPIVGSTSDQAGSVDQSTLRSTGWPESGPLGPRPTVRYGGAAFPAANPYLALVPDLDQVDWRYWRGYGVQQSAQRAAADLTAQPAAEPLLYEEQEPQRLLGSNDRQANAERIAGFGTASGERAAVLVLGHLAAERVPRPRVRPSREDDGSIPLARPTNIPGKRQGLVTRGVAGNGPHGSDGSGRGDFDYYKVRVPAGEQIVASAQAAGDSRLQPLVAVWGERGGLKAFDFPRNGKVDLTYPVPKAGTYYAMVVGCCTYPNSRFRSGSGTGAESEGRYRFSLSVSRPDRDFYAVHLEAGDVLGGTLAGAGQKLTVYGRDGRRAFGSSQDATFLYPEESPLPGGGRAVVSYVAPEAGRYTVAVTSGAGDYRAQLEVYRPGLERDQDGAVQTLFLDFDGERVNTGIWGGPGVRELSPLSAFLGRWGLRSRQENALIDQVVATVKENVRRDLARRGLNDDFSVRILNSRDHADPWGQPNVSRLIVGGTIRESGVFTIGIAQSIDPGNYGHEETALVLLDLLSGPERRPYSLNHYLTRESDRVAFVGNGIGNIVAHEAGHYLGNWHVDQFDGRPNLMDQGGNFAAMFGPGPDGVGGTEDDRDVDFGKNRLNPFEGFTGIEDTLNVTAFGLTSS
ncbi:MAG: hypothetical protein M3510_10845 [Actinomycetota bacterium]|nr:hypothetical protein [Actinomycetota bacterium]